MGVEAAKVAAINMRWPADKLAIVDTAASLLGTDRTSFVLGAACQRAEQVLLLQAGLVDDEAFDRFAAALEAVPLPMSGRMSHAETQTFA